MSDKKLNDRKPSFASGTSSDVQNPSDSSVMRDDVAKQPLVYLERPLDTRVKGQRLEFGYHEKYPWRNDCGKANLCLYIKK
jgi:hypothetical protein